MYLNSGFFMCWKLKLVEHGIFSRSFSTGYEITYLCLEEYMTSVKKDNGRLKKNLSRARERIVSKVLALHQTGVWSSIPHILSAVDPGVSLKDYQVWLKYLKKPYMTWFGFQSDIVEAPSCIFMWIMQWLSFLSLNSSELVFLSHKVEY